MKSYNYIVYTNGVITQTQFIVSDLKWYDWLTDWMAVVGGY